MVMVFLEVSGRSPSWLKCHAEQQGCPSSTIRFRTPAIRPEALKLIRGWALHVMSVLLRLLMHLDKFSKGLQPISSYAGCCTH